MTTVAELRPHTPSPLAPGEILHVDNSTLSAVGLCSTNALLRYYHGLDSPEGRAPLESGKAGHDAVCYYYKTSDAKGALAVFEGAYRGWSDENVEPGDRLEWSNCHKILEYWFHKNPIESLPFIIDPDLVEIGFAWPLNERTTIVGKMDAIVRLKEDGSLYIQDHKFTGQINSRWVRKFRLDSQPSTYLWAGNKHLEALGRNEKAIGMLINAIEFSKVPDSDRKCATHGVKYAECGLLHTKTAMPIVQRSAAQTAAWAENATMLADRFRLLMQLAPDLSTMHLARMEGTFNTFGACTSCAFEDFCAVGRPLANIPTMLVYNPWEPYPGAFGGRWGKADG